MKDEMFAFYPDGIQALLVDDDKKFLQSAITILSLLHFKVSTCGSPGTALKLLSGGDSSRNVNVVLADAHKAASCNFDFRAIVETDLRIPVIYFMSRESPIPTVNDEAHDFFRTVKSSTYIIKKPLDANELTNLWRVVAWKKCFLNSTYGGNVKNTDTSNGRHQGYNFSPILASTVDVVDREEDRVHYKVVRGGSRRITMGNTSNGSGNRPRKTQTNVKGMERHRVHSHLQKHRSNKRNPATGGLRDLPPQRSLDVLATLNNPSRKPSVFGDGAGAGPRNAATAAFTRGNGASSSMPPRPSQFHQPAERNVSSNIAPTAMLAENFTEVAFAGNGSRTLPPWPEVLQQLTGNISGGILPAARQAEEPRPTRAAQPNFPRMFLGPFAYQGPRPPPQSMLAAQDNVELQHGEAEVESSLTQQAAAENPAGSLATSLNFGAAPSEAIVEALLNMTATSDEASDFCMEDLEGLEIPMDIEGNGDGGSMGGWDFVLPDELLRENAWDSRMPNGRTRH